MSTVEMWLFVMWLFVGALLGGGVLASVLRAVRARLLEKEYADARREQEARRASALTIIEDAKTRLEQKETQQRQLSPEEKLSLLKQRLREPK